MATTAQLSPDLAARLDVLYRRYAGRVLALAAVRAKRPADVQDIAAETWMLACRYIASLRADDDHAMAWLRKVARTAARNYYRPRRSGELPEDWTDTQASRQLPAAPPADVDALALVDLTAQQATVFKLAAQGLTNGAIAARIGRNSGTVTRHLQRGARRLRTYELAG